MVRTKQEINQAVAILRHQGGALSNAQIAALQGGMTEQQVFKERPEED